jgi:hypothetical protein
LFGSFDFWSFDIVSYFGLVFRACVFSVPLWWYFPVLFPMDFSEAFKRPVKGAFHAVREAAGRQFLHGQVVLQTFAALALARTGFIGTIAVVPVFFLVAVHGLSLGMGET